MGVSVTIYQPLDAGQTTEPDTPYWENEYHKFFSANTTHNLTKMASAAKLYNVIWRPYKLFGLSDEDEYTRTIHAGELIDELQSGFDTLASDEEKFSKYNAENGWGSYKNFLPWVEKYLNACIKYPKAIVDVSR